MSNTQQHGKGPGECLQAADEWTLWAEARQKFEERPDQREMLVTADKILEQDLVPWLRTSQSRRPPSRGFSEMLKCEFELLHRQEMTVRYGGLGSEVYAHFLAAVTNLHRGMTKISSLRKASVIAEAWVSIASILRVSRKGFPIQYF